MLYEARRAFSRQKDYAPRLAAAAVMPVSTPAAAVSAIAPKAKHEVQPDRYGRIVIIRLRRVHGRRHIHGLLHVHRLLLHIHGLIRICLLYTSDAADE